MSQDSRPLIYHYSKNIDKRPFVFIFLSTLGLKFKEMFRNLCWGLTLLFIAFQGVAFANHTDQTGVGEERRETIIGLRYGMGKLLPHSQELHYLEAGRFQSLEVSFMRRGRGEEPWHNLYNYPSQGFTLSYTHRATPKLGYLITAATAVEFPLIDPRHKSSLNTRLSGGVAYLQYPFDPESNPRNLAIGTHINVFVQGMLEYTYPITNHWILSAGLQFNHISNGSFLKPNKGVNYLMANLGVNKTLNPREPIAQKESAPIIGDSWSLLLSASLNSPHISSDSQYGVVSLGLFHQRGMGQKLFWVIGAEAIYNAANRRGELVRRSEAPGRSINFQGGAYVGLGIQFGPNSISLSKGYLIGNKNIPTQGIYHRLGFKKELTENLFFHTGICSNYFKASFLDIGLGYKLD